MKPANIGRFFHHLKAKYHYSCFSLLPEIFMSIKNGICFHMPFLHGFLCNRKTRLEINIRQPDRRHVDRLHCSGDWFQDRS